jgi:hypothetical protein
MIAASHPIPWLLVAALAAVTSLAGAETLGAGAIAGVYHCDYGCRLTDVDPTIEIDGESADCMNELGGLFRGRMLSDRTIACFNKRGALSADGTILRWDDGVVWRRLSALPH